LNRIIFPVAKKKIGDTRVRGTRYMSSRVEMLHQNGLLSIEDTAPRVFIAEFKQNGESHSER
jgi:hypothetical protein